MRLIYVYLTHKNIFYPLYLDVNHATCCESRKNIFFKIEQHHVILPIKQKPNLISWNLNNEISFEGEESFYLSY